MLIKSRCPFFSFSGYESFFISLDHFPFLRIRVEIFFKIPLSADREIAIARNLSTKSQQMNKLLLLAFLILLPSALLSQNWQWARQPQATAHNQEVLGTSVSYSGEVFVCGYYQTSLNIGTATTLTVNFPGDYLDFVGKYDAAGNALWLRNVTGVVPNACAALDISSDTLGNCYVSYGYGYAFGTPGSIFNYASSYGGFRYLKKINSAGADVWTVSPTVAANSACTIESIKTDKSGNSFITGTFGGSVTFGSITLTSPSQSVFVVKYEPTGAVYYAVQGTGTSIGHSIDVDENGFVVIGGEFESSLTLGTTTLNGNGLRDFFLARLDPNGNFIWASSDGSTGHDEIYGVAIDNPRIYLTGIFNDNFTFGSIAVNTHGGQDILVACTDTSGNELWAVANGGGSSDDIGYDIATDHIGGVYAAGNYLGPATFGSTNLTGGNGAYLVKYDIIGIQHWVKKVVGSALNASGRSLSANTNPEIVMGSSFCCYGSTLDFSGSNISLSSNGGPGNYGSGYYISKLGDCSLIADAGTDVSINCSDTVSLSATGGSTYSWSPPTGLNTTTGSTVLAYPVVTTIYIVTAGDSTGCSDTDTVTVTVTGGPVISVTGSTAVCLGESTQLQALGATTWLWSPATGLDNPNISNPVATPVDTTTYTVTGTDAFGCSSSMPVTIIVNPLPPVPVITANVSVLTSTPASGYQWNLNGGPITGATGQSHTVLVNGIYTVTVTDVNGCEETSAPYLFNSVGITDFGQTPFIMPVPNPLQHNTELILSPEHTWSSPTLIILDITGRKISEIPFVNGRITLMRDFLTSGCYVYQLSDKGTVLHAGKLIVE